MNMVSFNDLPAWAMGVSLAVHLAAGIALGVLYFCSLWWNARRLSGDGRVTTVIAVMIGRFALLGAVLTLASLEGALPLLMTALGILIARSAIVRRVRKMAP